MTPMLIDKSKTGFARYCPTFAKGYENLRDSLRERKMRRCIKGLGHKRWERRCASAEGLFRLAQKGTDISPAFESLYEKLHDSYLHVRNPAALALGQAALNGYDISIALGRLGYYLLYGEFVGDVIIPGSFNWAAARAVACAAVNDKTRDSAMDIFLKLHDPRISQGWDAALEAMDHVAKYGFRSDEVLQLVISDLSGEDWFLMHSAISSIKRRQDFGEDVSIAMPAVASLILKGNSDRVRYTAFSILHKHIGDHQFEDCEGIVKSLSELIYSERFIQEAQNNSNLFIHVVGTCEQMLSKMMEKTEGSG